MNNEEFLATLPVPVPLVKFWGLGLPIWELPDIEPTGRWTIEMVETIVAEGIELLRSQPCNVYELTRAAQTAIILFHESRFPGRECTEELVLHRLYAVLFQLVMNVRDAGARMRNEYDGDDPILVTDIVIYDDPVNKTLEDNNERNT